MKTLKKGQFVVKVLRMMGTETATIERVESVKTGVVRLEGSSLKFNTVTLLEVDQAPGFSAVAHCKLVWFDGGEEQRWRLDEKGTER